jgi:tetratricopeptide (TPR) repeat protein
MNHIFLSYCAEDRERVRPLVALLGEVAPVWWDQAIHHGDDWEVAVENAVAEAACVVVAWTRDSVKSGWVRDEAAEARDRSILVPVKLDDVKPPFGFRRIQTAPLQGWDGDREHPQAQALKVAVARKMASGATSPPRPPPGPPRPSPQPGSPRSAMPPAVVAPPWWRAIGRSLWRRWSPAVAVVLLACSALAWTWWRLHQPARLYQRGLQAMSALDWPAARDDLERALSAAEDAPLERSALAEALYELGAAEQATTEVKRAFAARREIADDEGRLLVEARYQRITGNDAEAERKYQELLKTRPREVGYAVGLAQVQIAQGRFQQALTIVADMQRSSTDLRLDLLEVQAAIPTAGASARAFDAASRAVDGANKRGLDLVAAKGLLLRAIAHFYQGELQPAIDDFAAAEERSRVRNPVLAAEAHNGIAAVRYEQGNLVEAEKSYERALRSYQRLGDRDREADQQTYLAAVRAELGKLGQARTAFEQATKKSDPSQRAQALANLGWVLYQQGYLPQAAESLRQANGIFEETGELEERAANTCRLALLYADMLELSLQRRALAACRELADEAAGPVKYRNGEERILAEARSTEGKLRFLQGDLKRAWEAQRDALKMYEKRGRNRETALSQLDLAEIQLEKDSASEARPLIERALEYFAGQRLADDAALARAALARTYLVEGATARARSLIEQAKERAADSELARLRAEVALVEAHVLAAMQKMVEARDVIQRELDDPQMQRSPRRRLDARLAQGAVEAAYGDRARGRELLSQVREDAEARGYRLVANKAARLLAGP